MAAPLALLAIALAVIASSFALVQAEVSSAVRRVVATGQPVPGGGSFDRFGVESMPIVAPINGKGQVAFFATLTRARGGEGIFLASGTRIAKVALEGDSIASGGGTISGFGKHPVPALNESGAVAFAAAIAGGKVVEGVFVAEGARRRTVALSGGAAVGLSSGTFASLDAPALNDRGDVAFLATVRRGRETIDAIYLHTGGALKKLVAQGDPAPAGGTFALFGVPVLSNSGAVAFAAAVEGQGVPGGIFAAESERIRMVVGAGEETPIGGIFAKFSERVALADSGSIAFNTVLKNGPTPSAVFLAADGTIKKVAAVGDAAPGGGRFSYLGLWPSLGRGGTMAFAASVDGGPSPMAVFATAPEGLRRLASVGDALPGGGKLASFTLYPVVAVSPSGAVTFATAPTAIGEGAEGIFAVAPGAVR
jgi:hypothetical protein